MGLSNRNKVLLAALALCAAGLVVDMVFLRAGPASAAGATQAATPEPVVVAVAPGGRDDVQGATSIADRLARLDAARGLSDLPRQPYDEDGFLPGPAFAPARLVVLRDGTLSVDASKHSLTSISRAGDGFFAVVDGVTLTQGVEQSSKDTGVSYRLLEVIDATKAGGPAGARVTINGREVMLRVDADKSEKPRPPRSPR